MLFASLVVAVTNSASIRSENIDGTTLTLEQSSSVVIDNVFNEGKLTRYVLEA